MWNQHINATSLGKVIDLLDHYQSSARVIAGGTDLILEIERGIRKDIGTLIDISRVTGLNDIRLDEDGCLHLGPMVTHNQMVTNPLARQYAYPLVEACWRVGSPQIRNRATIAGNLITGSPANDTITPLMALNASVSLLSDAGTRTLKLSEFYSGVRKTQLKPNELLVDISFKGMRSDQAGAFYKYGLRNAQAISVVNACVILSMSESRIQSAKVTLGSVAPVIIHSGQAEKYLTGRRLSEKSIKEAGKLAAKDAKPIDDLRASAVFRKYLVSVCVTKALRTINLHKEIKTVPGDPVLLATQIQTTVFSNNDKGQIQTTINGKKYSFNDCGNKTLLRLIREDAGLTGTKEGCAEGECGACTVFLDGQAVMSCLVPAGRAHGAEIITIEGLARDGKLNPVQQGFVDKGAVQCGYCTPGMIMSATKLLEEKTAPDGEQIVQALAGNLCRCTGYYQILEAVETAIKR
jgi:xanthine dehydrogenase iron-sulfur cluster and FAD-binding subunit A